MPRELPTTPVNPPPLEMQGMTLSLGKTTSAVAAATMSAGKFKFTVLNSGGTDLDINGDEFDCYNIFGSAVATDKDILVGFHPQSGRWYILQADC